MSVDNRPTSPHLTIYKPQITSILSITHRMTGVALYAGTALLVWWLWTLAYMPEQYAKLHECLVSPIGQVMLFGWVFSFFYHFGNGIRHLFWDIGMGFTLPQLTRSGVLVIIFSVGMTALTWALVYQYISITPGMDGAAPTFLGMAEPQGE